MHIRHGVLIAAACCLAGCGGGMTPQISISGDTLEKAVERGFPLTNAGDEDAKVIVELADPKVLLEDGRDQVGLKVQVTAKPASEPPVAKLLPKAKFGKAKGDGEAVKGTVTMYGDLSYNDQEKAFYYQNPTFEDVSLDLPEALHMPARKIIERLLGDYLAENPVYKLEGDDAATQAAGKLLRGLTVKDGRIYIELGM